MIRSHWLHQGRVTLIPVFGERRSQGWISSSPYSRRCLILSNPTQSNATQCHPGLCLTLAGSTSNFPGSINEQTHHDFHKKLQLQCILFSYKAESSKTLVKFLNNIFPLVLSNHSIEPPLGAMWAIGLVDELWLCFSKKSDV